MSPVYETLDKGHGRIERRQLRASSALCGYSDFPGLQQVFEIRKRVVQPVTGELISEGVTFLATSLTAEKAPPARLLALARGHWSIENRLHRVRDDQMGEDRHVDRTHQGGEVLSLLRNTALNLLRGTMLWGNNKPLTARAQIVAHYPISVLLLTSAA